MELGTGHEVGRAERRKLQQRRRRKRKEKEEERRRKKEPVWLGAWKADMENSQWVPSPVCSQQQWRRRWHHAKSCLGTLFSICPHSCSPGQSPTERDLWGFSCSTDTLTPVQHLLSIIPLKFHFKASVSCRKPGESAQQHPPHSNYSLYR